MKLHKTAAVAEIVSSIAIVVTLAYLVVQTREMANQTSQMAAQTEQTNLALNANTQATVMAADLSYIFAGLQHPEASPGLGRERSESEEFSVLAFTAASTRIREFLWWQKEAGLVDDATWNSYIGTLVRNIEVDSGYRRAWQQMSSTLTPGFVAEVESRVSN